MISFKYVSMYSWCFSGHNCIIVKYCNYCNYWDYWFLMIFFKFRTIFISERFHSAFDCFIFFFESTKISYIFKYIVLNSISLSFFQVLRGYSLSLFCFLAYYLSIISHDFRLTVSLFSLFKYSLLFI